MRKVLEGASSCSCIVSPILYNRGTARGQTENARNGAALAFERLRQRDPPSSSAVTRRGQVDLEMATTNPQLVALALANVSDFEAEVAKRLALVLQVRAESRRGWIGVCVPALSRGVAVRLRVV